MKTYAQALYKEPFDWNDFLNKKVITEEEWWEATGFSSRWVTCACGNQCRTIPRFHSGMPIDNELSTLGCDFNDAILERNIIKARRILENIEKRSAELIAEINQKTL